MLVSFNKWHSSKVNNKAFLLISAADVLCPQLFACEKPTRDEGIFADTDSMIFKIDDTSVLDSICGWVIQD